MTGLEGRPALKAGCRLSPQGDVLLFPEGALRLQGPARHILEACDGTRTMPQIRDQLLQVFPTAEPGKVLAETEAFIQRLNEKGLVEIL